MIDFSIDQEPCEDTIEERPTMQKLEKFNELHVIRNKAVDFGDI